MQLTITQSDLLQIEELIEDFLSSFYPDQDFSRGTPLNDLLIQGFKVPLSLLSSVATRFQQTRSLSGIQELLDAVNAGDQTDPDIIDAQAELESAVLEVLSNWYITKQQGTRSRGLINLHFSSNPPVLLPADFKAFRTLDLPYTYTGETDLLINSSDYQVITDADGVVLEYIYRIVVEADFQGFIGDVEPGTWESFDQFTPFLTRVSNDFDFTQGTDEESTQDLIDRAQDGGVTERTLHNERALNARFGQDFPEYLPVRVIGAGDPEMQRDLLQLGGTFRIHQLNHYNIYIGGNIEESRVYTGITGRSEANPRTGEAIPEIDNTFLLPRAPILNIREIRWLNDGVNPLLAAYTDTDGYVRISLQSKYKNDSLGRQTIRPFTDLPQAYIEPVSDEDVSSWGTAFQAHRLVINPQLFQRQGLRIEVIYDTIQGFEVIHDLIQNINERPGAGDPLVYSYNAAVVTFTLRYQPREDAQTSVDVAEAKRVLTTFIRSQKNGNPLFASEIMREFMDNFGDIAAGVFPITLNYTVQLPDGGILEFQTDEKVSLGGLTNLVSSSYVPAYEDGSSQMLSELQLSDRTMIVFADETGIDVQEG